MRPWNRPNRATLRAATVSSVYVPLSRVMSGESKMPPIPASSPARTQEMAPTWAVLIPRLCAKRGRSTTARVAKPSLVRSTSKTRPITQTSEPITATSWFLVAVTNPRWTKKRPPETSRPLHLSVGDDDLHQGRKGHGQPDRGDDDDQIGLFHLPEHSQP